MPCIETAGASVRPYRTAYVEADLYRIVTRASATMAAIRGRLVGFVGHRYLVMALDAKCRAQYMNRFAKDTFAVAVYVGTLRERSLPL